MNCRSSMLLLVRAVNYCLGLATINGIERYQSWNEIIRCVAVERFLLDWDVKKTAFERHCVISEGSTRSATRQCQGCRGNRGTIFEVNLPSASS